MAGEGKEKHDFIRDASSLDVSNMSSSTLMIATFDVMVVGYRAVGNRGHFSPILWQIN